MVIKDDGILEIELRVKNDGDVAWPNETVLNTIAKGGQDYPPFDLPKLLPGRVGKIFLSFPYDENVKKYKFEFYCPSLGYFGKRYVVTNELISGPRDGGIGHLVQLKYKAIKGRKLTDKLEQIGICNGFSSGVNYFFSRKAKG